MPEQRNKKILDGVREQAFNPLDEILKSLDRELVEQTGAEIIEADVFCIDDGRIRHDALKTAFLIFSYLMARSNQRLTPHFTDEPKGPRI